MIRRQASLVGASGFSQNTGLPAPIAATTCSSWAAPQDATSTASTVCVRDEIDGRRVHGRAGQTGRDLPGAGRVDVVDRDHLSAGEDLGDPADVVLADHADADDANAYGHGYSLPMPTPRR